MLKIREYRKQRKLTIKELAAMTGMSISYISQVERGEIDPSLFSLRKIASVFQLPLYMLLDDEEIMGNLTLRKDQQLVRVSEDGSITYRFLTPIPSPGYSPQSLLMNFTLAPHAQDVPEPVRHSSEEMIYVMEGQLTVQIGNGYFRHLPARLGTDGSHGTGDLTPFAPGTHTLSVQICLRGQCLWLPSASV